MMPFTSWARDKMASINEENGTKK